MFETFPKVIWGQSQVAVELHDEIPAIAAKGTVAVIEGFHYSAAGLAEASVHSVYDADPWQLSCMPIDNFTRPVGGTVVDDYPFRRLYRLALDGSDGRFDEPFLIAYWRNDYVLRHFFHGNEVVAGLVKSTQASRWIVASALETGTAIARLSRNLIARENVRAYCNRILSLANHP
jgi:hypothetical protein